MMSIKTLTQINTEIENLKNKIKELEKEKFKTKLLSECFINEEDIKDVENLSVSLNIEEHSSEQDEYAYSWNGKLVIKYLYKGTITPEITVSYDHDQTHYNRFSPYIDFRKEYIHVEDGGPLIKKILEYIHNDCSDNKEFEITEDDDSYKEIGSNWKQLMTDLK